jgi:hypothetical protein
MAEGDDGLGRVADLSAPTGKAGGRLPASRHRILEACGDFVQYYAKLLRVAHRPLVREGCFCCSLATWATTHGDAMPTATVRPMPARPSMRALSATAEFWGPPADAECSVAAARKRLSQGWLRRAVRGCVTNGVCSVYTPRYDAT